jgi:hypothetical protein
MSAPLSEAEIAAMLADADLHDGGRHHIDASILSDHVRALAAEVTRLRAVCEDWQIQDGHRRREFDAQIAAARADLAKAVELLRCITETPTPIPGVTTAEYHDLVAAFLATQEPRR